MTAAGCRPLPPVPRPPGRLPSWLGGVCGAQHAACMYPMCREHCCHQIIRVANTCCAVNTLCVGPRGGGGGRGTGPRQPTHLIRQPARVCYVSRLTVLFSAAAAGISSRVRLQQGMHAVWDPHSRQAWVASLLTGVNCALTQLAISEHLWIPDTFTFITQVAWTDLGRPTAASAWLPQPALGAQ